MRQIVSIIALVGFFLVSSLAGMSNSMAKSMDVKHVAVISVEVQQTLDNVDRVDGEVAKEHDCPCSKKPGSKASLVCGVALALPSNSSTPHMPSHIVALFDWQSDMLPSATLNLLKRPPRPIL